MSTRKSKPAEQEVVDGDWDDVIEAANEERNERLPAVPSYDVSEFLTYDDALRAFGESIVLANDVELVKDKGELIGTPFLIVNYNFNMDSITQREYVSVGVITLDNKRIVFNDGSTGVYRTLKGMAERGIKGGIVCRNGLRVSEYFLDEDKNIIPKGNPDNVKVDTVAKTFYLA